LESAAGGELLLRFEGGAQGPADDWAAALAEMPEVTGENVWDVISPALRRTWVALPVGSTLRAEVESSEFTPLEWPAGMTPEAIEQARRILPAEPQAHVILEAASWMRNVRAAPLILSTIGVDASGNARLLRGATIRVFRSGPPAGENARLQGATRAAIGASDPFEETYRRLLVNYEESRSWRRTAAPRARGMAEDYFSTNPDRWVKVAVTHSGIHQIRGSDVDALGAGIAGVDPATLRMFAPSLVPYDEALLLADAPSWMEEIPITVLDQGGDGEFDSEDRIIFLGHGPDAWLQDLSVDDTEFERYHRDYYNNANTYWLTWGEAAFAEPPRRMEVRDGSSVTEPYLTQVRDRVHFEEDRIWDPRAREVIDSNNPVVPFWDRFRWLSLDTNESDTEQIVRLSPLDPVVSEPVRFLGRFWGNSWQPTSSVYFPDHRLRVRFNGTLIADVDSLSNGRPWDYYVHRDVDQTGTYLRAGSSQEISLVLPRNPKRDPSLVRIDHVALSWIELEYTRLLRARADSLDFFAAGLSGTHSFEIRGFTTDQLIVIDAGGPEPARILPALPQVGDSVVVRFAATLPVERPGRYWARSLATLPVPGLERSRLGSAELLRDRSAASDMIILTHRDFLDGAAAWADYRAAGFPGREAGERANVHVVDVQQVFDEFSFGRVDPTAIRLFLEMARDQWTGGVEGAGPAYLLLLGDAHYDYRDQLMRGSRNWVPTCESYYDRGFQVTLYSPQFASDDYYGYLEGPNDRGLDYYIGRVPVRLAYQVEDVLNKTRDYETPEHLGAGRGRITMVADDLCQRENPDNLGLAHMQQTEALLPEIPRTIQNDKIYLYEYGTECVYDRKPAAADALSRRIEEGTLVLNYTGHGSEQQLADERIFESAGVAGLTNSDGLFLFVTASCSVGKFDYTGESLGESTLLLRGGGAIGVLSATSIALSTGNAELNQKFYRALFPGRLTHNAQPLGKAAAEAKALLQSPGNLNSKRYAYLGDPAVRIAAPRMDVDLALFDAVTGVSLGDSLVSGVLTEVRGQVRRPDGEPASDFTGQAALRIYDSGPLRVARDSGRMLEYGLIGAPIFRAEVEVVDGVFATRFLTPTTLRRGENAPAAVYVHVANEFTDGAGALDSLTIPARDGGSGSDVQGPAIELTLDGDPGSLRPGASFTATFYDESGINITGLVRSRSVLMEIVHDGETVHVEDLADRVEFQGDFQNAKLTAQLPSDLPAERQYVLVVKASDNVKNASRAEVSFVLSGSSDQAFALAGVFNFPNPADGPTRFFGTVNRMAEVQVEVYTSSGRRIWRLDRALEVTPDEFSAGGIEWDGRDEDGDVPANGMYFYKITARPLMGGGAARSATGKLIISR